MIACTMPDEKYFRYEQEHGESQCEMYDSCEECPWYDEKKGESDGRKEKILSEQG